MSNKNLKILTVQQLLVCCYFPSFVYSTITKQVESSWTVEPSILLDRSSNIKKVQQLSIKEDGLFG